MNIECVNLNWNFHFDQLIQFRFPISRLFEFSSFPKWVWVSSGIYFLFCVWSNISDQINLAQRNAIRFLTFIRLFHSMLESNLNCFITQSSGNLNWIHECFKFIWPRLPRWRLKNQLFSTRVITIACKLDHIKICFIFILLKNYSRTFIHFIYWIFSLSKKRAHGSSCVHQYHSLDWKFFNRRTSINFN